MKRLKDKKGFTLIELIVVLAILVVLMAIALPTFSGLIDDSKQKTADANARTVYTAAKAYITMNSTEPVSDTDSIYADAIKKGIDDYLGEGFDDVTITSILYKTDGTITVEVSSENKKGTYPVD